MGKNAQDEDFNEYNDFERDDDYNVFEEREILNDEQAEREYGNEDEEDELTNTGNPAISQEQLAMKKCAYRLSLRGAPPTTNKTGVTLKIPKDQVFNPEALKALANRIAIRDFPCYLTT